MAATNYTPIQLYHSTTASAAPTSGNLVNGELAINIADGKLYYKDSGGTVQIIASKGTGTIGGSTTQVQYNLSGALAGSSNFVFDGTTATINTLNLTNALGATYGGTAQSSWTTGDLLYASGSNTLAKLGIGLNTYILTSNGSIPGWAAPSAISVNTATNLAGGAAGSVPYQSGAGATTFLSIGTANQVVTSTGTAPQWSSGLSITTLTASDAVTFSATTQNIDLGTSQTSGTFTIGGAAQTGSQTFDQSTKTHTLNIGAGATENTLTKTINIGTGGVSGSTTAINIGSTNGTTVTVNGTVNATTVNVTTLDLTNLEVTNIKAKDGTAAMSIADSTGAVTISSAFAANGGVTIGDASGDAFTINSSAVSTPNGLNFDSNTFVIDASNNRVGINNASPTVALDVTGALTISGNAILGDASTDTVQVNGYIGLGTPSPSRAINIESSALTGTSQTGVYSTITGTSAATSSVRGFTALPATAAAAFTATDVAGYWFAGVVKGAGSTITNAHGLYLTDISAGTNNYGITSAVSSGSNKWNIYASGTAANYFAGDVGIGVTNPNYKLEVNGGASDAMSLFNSTNANGAHLRFAASGAIKSYIGGAPGFLGSGTADDLGIRAVGSILFATAGSGVDMTLDSSGNLGIGDTPDASARLTVAKNDGIIYLKRATGTAYPFSFGIASDGRFNIYDATAATERFSITQAGNVGIGVTPSAWNGYTALQVKGASSLASSGVETELATNAYYDIGWKYSTTGPLKASRYESYNGYHAWFTDNTGGTKGNPISSFTQAMTLNASGNLLVGTTSASGIANKYIDINDTTDNCAINFKVADVGQGYIYVDDSSDEMRIGATGASNVNALTMYAGGSERARIDSAGTVFMRDGTSTTNTNSSRLVVGGTISETVSSTQYLVASQYDIGTAPNDIPLNQYLGSLAYQDASSIAGQVGLSAGTAALPSLVSATDTDTGMWFPAANTLAWSTGGTERARITSGGNFGVGTTSPIAFSNQTSVTVNGTNTGRFDLKVGDTHTGALVATSTYVDLTAITNIPITFGTNSTERARITSGGYFKASNDGNYVGSTAAYHELRQTANNYVLQLRATDTTTYTSNVIFIVGDRTTTNSTYNLVSAQNGNGTGVFIVRDSGNAVNTNGSYGTTSDQKLKQDIVDAGSQWADLKAIRFRKYRLKNDVAANPDAPALLGVVAQELEQVSPGLVEESPDRDAEGNDLGTTTKSVKTSVLLMKAAVALQEAMARIEKLEAEMAALKGA